MNLLQILQALKAHLQGDTTLSCIETTAVRKYTKESLPTFTDYCIILSPVKRRKERLSNNVYIYIYFIDVVVVVRNFNPENSLLGDNPPGVITLVDLVSTSLKTFLNNNKTTLTVKGDEVSADVDYNTHKYPEREEYFHETIIPMHVQTKPF